MTMGNPLVSGIVSTAQALGVSPVDLATVISYETGGTFNPTQPGPHTQWGQHRGLIQFGEPQAQQYGVDWNDPLGSQLGPNGAIVRYLRGSGFQNGMGLLDLYSTINAGAPGRYNASDANNGGAPGTVADKVNEQMAGHRQNALRLLGGMAGQDTTTGGAGGDTLTAPQGILAHLTQPPAAQRRSSIWDRFEGRGGILGYMANPDNRAHAILALGNLTMNPNEALMEQARDGLAQRDQDAQREATAQWLEANGGGDWAAAVRAGIDPQQAVGGFMQSMQPPTPADPLTLSPGETVWDPNTQSAIYTAPAAAGSGPEVWTPISPEEAASRGLPAGGVYERSSSGQTRVVTPAPEGKGGVELGDINDLQKTYRAEAPVQRMQDVATAYGTLHAAAQANDPGSNIAFVYSFMKMLDPGSVVRETEFGMVAESGSIDQQILNQLNGFLNGQRMTPEQKQEFLGVADRIYQDAASAYGPVYDHYAGLAAANGIAADQGPIDYRREWTPLDVPVPGGEQPPPGAETPIGQLPAPAAAPTGAFQWPATPAIQQMSLDQLQALLQQGRAAGAPIPPEVSAAILARTRGQ